MQSTMMRLPLSLNHLLERAGALFPESQIVSRLPDKSLRCHSYAEFYRRARALGAALKRLGLEKGDRVATLLWNHHAHLECYFGIPAAAGVMHTLNLRLAPSDIGWIAAHAVELENAIMAHPAVAEAAVIAIAHEKWGERPLACVVLKPGQQASPEELNALLGRQFAKWQRPDRYDFIAEIPRTSTGKFWKAKLRERYNERSGSPTA